ncbi:hypothetical protein GPECTOR_11g190 [Gonium pectorale]|uniref:Uncharacterized protein n=1 Tax=Gonium pectorale TaxID=33097 RepID=A0A150GPL9_GONPE|nr:hypothetical protein GPECTOR_11g190 [Gonium pectorale]|eukprot:KXZ51744.1 hypothetical protein GPECTOR_11g190 [Gonium pectorale]
MGAWSLATGSLIVRAAVVRQIRAALKGGPAAATASRNDQVPKPRLRTLMWALATRMAALAILVATAFSVLPDVVLLRAAPAAPPSATAATSLADGAGGDARTPNAAPAAAPSSATAAVRNTVGAIAATDGAVSAADGRTSIGPDRALPGILDGAGVSGSRDLVLRLRSEDGVGSFISGVTSSATVASIRSLSTQSIHSSTLSCAASNASTAAGSCGSIVTAGALPALAAPADGPAGLLWQGEQQRQARQAASLLPLPPPAEAPPQEGGCGLAPPHGVQALVRIPSPNSTMDFDSGPNSALLSAAAAAAAAAFSATRAPAVASTSAAQVPAREPEPLAVAVAAAAASGVRRTEEAGGFLDIHHRRGGAAATDGSSGSAGGRIDGGGRVRRSGMSHYAAPARDSGDHNKWPADAGATPASASAPLTQLNPPLAKCVPLDCRPDSPGSRQQVPPVVAVAAAAARAAVPAAPSSNTATVTDLAAVAGPQPPPAASICSIRRLAVPSLLVRRPAAAAATGGGGLVRVGSSAPGKLGGGCDGDSMDALALGATGVGGAAVLGSVRAAPMAIRGSGGGGGSVLPAPYRAITRARLVSVKIHAHPGTFADYAPAACDRIHAYLRANPLPSMVGLAGVGGAGGVSGAGGGGGHGAGAAATAAAALMTVKTLAVPGCVQVISWAHSISETAAAGGGAAAAAPRRSLDGGLRRVRWGCGAGGGAAACGLLASLVDSLPDVGQLTAVDVEVDGVATSYRRAASGLPAFGRLRRALMPTPPPLAPLQAQACVQALTAGAGAAGGPRMEVAVMWVRPAFMQVGDAGGAGAAGDGAAAAVELDICIFVGGSGVDNCGLGDGGAAAGPSAAAAAPRVMHAVVASPAVHFSAEANDGGAASTTPAIPAPGLPAPAGVLASAPLLCLPRAVAEELGDALGAAVAFEACAADGADVFGVMASLWEDFVTPIATDVAFLTECAAAGAAAPLLPPAAAAKAAAAKAAAPPAHVAGGLSWVAGRAAVVGLLAVEDSLRSALERLGATTTVAYVEDLSRRAMLAVLGPAVGALVAPPYPSALPCPGTRMCPGIAGLPADAAAVAAPATVPPDGSAADAAADAKRLLGFAVAGGAAAAAAGAAEGGLPRSGGAGLATVAAGAAAAAAPAGVAAEGVGLGATDDMSGGSGESSTSARSIERPQTPGFKLPAPKASNGAGRGVAGGSSRAAVKEFGGGGGHGDDVGADGDGGSGMPYSADLERQYELYCGVLYSGLDLAAFAMLLMMFLVVTWRKLLLPAAGSARWLYNIGMLWVVAGTVMAPYAVKLADGHLYTAHRERLHLLCQAANGLVYALFAARVIPMPPEMTFHWNHSHVLQRGLVRPVRRPVRFTSHAAMMVIEVLCVTPAFLAFSGWRTTAATTLITYTCSLSVGYALDLAMRRVFLLGLVRRNRERQPQRARQE